MDLELDEKLYDALKESLRLQSHYAELLNIYDGGKRRTFDSVEAWLRRLEETKSGSGKETARS